MFFLDVDIRAILWFVILFVSLSCRVLYRSIFFIYVHLNPHRCDVLQDLLLRKSFCILRDDTVDDIKLIYCHIIYRKISIFSLNKSDTCGSCELSWGCVYVDDFSYKPVGKYKESNDGANSSCWCFEGSCLLIGKSNRLGISIKAFEELLDVSSHF